MIYPFRRIFAFSMMATVSTVALVAITGAGVGGMYAIAFGCLAISLVIMLRADLPWYRAAKRRQLVRHRILR